MLKVKTTGMTLALSAAGSVFAPHQLALAQVPLPPPPRESIRTSRTAGLEFVIVDNIGNVPFTGPLGNEASVTRGRVDYEYAISRTEIPTSLWLEFHNTFVNRVPGGVTFALPLETWGAIDDPDIPGRFVLDYRFSDHPENLPVTGITWRDAAMFANWLHNDRSSDLSAIANGAYDISTFGFQQGGEGTVMTDQLRRSPGARFWIPSLDEWQKAVYFDPDRYGPEQPGWWTYPNRTDTPLIPGPPGEGQTNAGFELPNRMERVIPLGAYPDQQSPWGLLDASGAASEILEDAFIFDPLTGLPVFYRRFGGSRLAYPLPELADVITFGGSNPAGTHEGGLRIASAIPAPGLVWCFPVVALLLARRRS